ncbi:MAG: RagB/SusD family nutrient uptake outer membrane protein [Emticicia sp.]|nr:RagB/SusD family nutrient uptake outer membrane protein [Emticicia sp.]
MKNIYKILLGLTLCLTTISCEKTFLDEKSESSLTPENAFNSAKDFQASMNNLYRLVRLELYTRNDNQPWNYAYRTDIGFPITAAAANLSGDYNAVNGFSNGHWNPYFKIIAEANTVIGRIPTSKLTDAEKKSFEAQGRFFRAFAYRCLSYLYGGVPLILEEVKSPKSDFVRATRKEVYAQVITDLKFAAENLKAITAVKDGEVSNLVAQHYLSEVYLADGQFQNAVTAADVVISNPNVRLMTARFGSRRTETPGDVYWDLFRRNNQNRAGNTNTEGLWVIQLEPDTPGGTSLTTVGFYNTNGFFFERVHAPLFRDLRVNGVTPFNWPLSDYSGGRGVGFMAPSKYFIENAYDDPTNDIRNANHNFVRKFRANNIASPLFGREIDFANIPTGTTGVNGVRVVSGVSDRAIYPYQTKCTDPFGHPEGLLAGNNPNYPRLLKSGAGATYQDQYLVRLAETYLLRAEANLGLGKLDAAATDINVVRSRAKAAPAKPSDVNIDYILDERIREFGFEEKRMFTLMRLGKWADRVRKCNPFYASQVQDKYNLWPIPQGEIDRNTGAVLEQNPGY